ncbi:MAG TPA: putative Ig domain-containing protein [Vulgatibacter sp.]|nr:putative Ig domain-containing protein [Vulgatibacter sp.]
MLRSCVSRLPIPVAFALFVLAPFAAHANLYTLTTQPHTFEPLPLAGGGPVTSLSNGSSFGGDSPAPLEAQVTLPFPVNFFGNDETNMYVGSSGYVTLGTTHHATTYTPRAIPGSSAPHNLIAVWWDRLVCDSTFLGHTHGPVLTQVVGTAPSRAFVVQWTECRKYAVTGSYVTAQLWLFEGSNHIEVHYGDIVPGAATNFKASMGIENSTGTEGTPGVSNQGTVCNPTCDASLFPSQTKFTYSSGPALQVASFTGDPSGFPGVTYNAVATVANVGGEDALGVGARFWLSEDETVPSTSTPLLVHPAQTIASGTSTTYTLSVPLPSVPDGQYYVIAEIDHTHAVSPNPLVASLGPISVETTAPDAAVGPVLVSQRVDVGGTINVRWNARNLGSLGATDVPFVVTLGSTQDFSSGPTWVLETGTIDLPTGADEQIEADYPLPSEAGMGRYWVEVVIDPDETLGETQLGNNRNVSTGFVVAPELLVDTTELPIAYVNEPYSVPLVAQGGDGTYTWSVPVGSLPQGLSLQQDGSQTLLAGTPTRVASSTFTLEAESMGLRKRVNLSLFVVERLRITTSTLPSWSVGDAVAVDLMASGGTPFYSWSVVAGELPKGLELLGSGLLFGSPTETYNGTVTFGVTDEGGQSATAELAMVVTSNVPPTIEVEVPASLILGTAATGLVLEASGGNPPYTWVTAQSTRRADTLWAEAIVRTGEAPPGLELSEDGVVTGTPTEAGTFDWKVTVEDALGLTGAVDFVVTVEPDHTLKISPGSLPPASVGEEYEVLLESDAEGTATFSLAEGSALPDGLSLDSSGRISGTPTREQLLGEESRDFSFTVRVADAAFRQGEATLSMGVTDPEWSKPDPEPKPNPNPGSPKSSKSSGGCQSAGGALGLAGFAVIAGIAILRRRR